MKEKDYLDCIINQIDSIKVNVLNGKPALKKPLLLLLLISKFEQGIIKQNKIFYKDLEKELEELILNFGGRTSTAKAYQPFQYMNRSLNLPIGIKMSHSRDLPVSVLRNSETFAELDIRLYQYLKTSIEVRARLFVRIYFTKMVVTINSTRTCQHLKSTINGLYYGKKKK